MKEKIKSLSFLGRAFGVLRQRSWSKSSPRAVFSVTSTARGGGWPTFSPALGACASATQPENRRADNKQMKTKTQMRIHTNPVIQHASCNDRMASWPTANAVGETSTATYPTPHERKR